MLDGHFHFGNVKVALAAEPDLLFAVGSFLTEMGAELAVCVTTTASPLLARMPAVEVVIGDHRTFRPGPECFGVLVQYPDTTGSIHDFTDFFAAAHAAGAFTIAAADLPNLTSLEVSTSAVGEAGVAALCFRSPSGSSSSSRSPSSSSGAMPHAAMRLYRRA